MKPKIFCFVGDLFPPFRQPSRIVFISERAFFSADPAVMQKLPWYLWEINGHTRRLSSQRFLDQHLVTLKREHCKHSLQKFLCWIILIAQTTQSTFLLQSMMKVWDLQINLKNFWKKLSELSFWIMYLLNKNIAYNWS